MDFLIGRQFGKGMSAYTLKTIAIVAMVVDHVAAAFVPAGIILWQVMHAIGRLTAPIMCYFIAEGYYHTRNVTRYAMRLGCFALISHFPFCFFEFGRWPVSDGGLKLYPTSIIWTLFLGLISLIVWSNDRLSPAVKGILISGLCAAALFGDGSFSVVLCILGFGMYRGDFKKQALALLVTLAIPNLLMTLEPYWLGAFLVIPLLRQYNGSLGGGKHSKWFFYVFYPLHLLVIRFLGRSL